MKKTYSEKLKDPRWQQMRLKVMERDQFTCRKCRSKDKTLNVHHLAYAKGKAPWEYDGEALMTLCEECHAYVEDFDCKLAFGFFMATRGMTVDAARRILTYAMIAAHVTECSPEEISTEMMKLAIREDAVDIERNGGPSPTEGVISKTIGALR